MSGISENEDGSINIDITDEEWDAWVEEQEKLKEKFFEMYNKMVEEPEEL